MGMDGRKGRASQVKPGPRPNYLREQELWRRAHEVACPKCGAKPGSHCKTLNVSDAAIVHGPRVDAARDGQEGQSDGDS